MTSTNYILQFGGSCNPPDIETDGEYAADAMRTAGWQTGVVRQEFLNKVDRQGNSMSAGLGQFIADNQNGTTDVTDDLSPATLALMIKDAVTQVVPESGGSLLGINTYGVDTTLTLADVGFLVLPSAGSLTFTLPLSSGSNVGSVIQFNGNSFGVTLSKQGSDTILLGSTGAVPSASLLSYDSATLINNGSGWTVLDGEMHQAVSSSFANSLTTDGWGLLPGGRIEQWGALTIELSAGTHKNVVSLPTPWQNGLLGGTVCYFGEDPPNIITNISISPNPGNPLTEIAIWGYAPSTLPAEGVYWNVWGY